MGQNQTRRCLVEFVVAAAVGGRAVRTGGEVCYPRLPFLLIVFRLSGSDDVVTKTPTQAGITVIIISNLINGGGAGRVDYGGEVYTLVVPVRQILGRAQLIIVHTVHRAPSGDRNSSHAFARLVHICCLE